MEFYIAVLEQDCTPHYFEKADNAIKYLEQNCRYKDCAVEPNNTKENGEVWDKDGISVGYFYKVSTED